MRVGRPYRLGLSRGALNLLGAHTRLALMAAALLVPVLATAASAQVFGIIQGTQPSADSMADYKRAGVNAVVVELSWADYEPAQGAYNLEYIARARDAVRALRRNGIGVCLEACLHYTPDWVFRLSPNSRFVNQYGDVWQTDQFGNDVPNSVFDPGVRAAQTSYIARIARDFGDAFTTIRCGGLGYGELRYPRATYNAHANSYWCFDANAQAGSPVPGWKPGDPDPARARKFVEYYLDSLVKYQNWLIDEWRSHFPKASIMVLYPSWGLRPGDIRAAVANRLDGRTSPEINSEFAMGTDFARQIASIRDRNVWAYCTWMERVSEGPGHRLESPIEYIAYLAKLRGIPVAGENAGNNTAGEMALCVSRARRIPMSAMFWMSERQMGIGTNATLADYGRLIRGSSKDSEPCAVGSAQTTSPRY